jgi:hypothetical protein
MVLIHLQLAQDDTPLQFRLLWVKQGVGHSVSLYVKGDEPILLRQSLKVSGVVIGCVTVQDATVFLDETGNLSFRELWRPFKKHVLNPVADSSYADLLVPRTDSVKRPNADDRRVMNGRNENLQAVRQNMFANLH